MDRGLQRALVTGASSGIGEEFARQLAARGLGVVLVARREGELKALAEELEDISGVATEVLTADLTLDEDLRVVEERLREGGEARIDLLINNAGFGAYGRFHELDGALQATMVELNVSAVVRLSHAILPHLLAERRGGIINVASTAAFQPDPYGAVYGGTKAFVHSFSQAIHEEVRGQGVRVMSLAPGFTRTEFQDSADVADDAMPEPGVMHPEDVVATALRHFAKGKAVSIPGVANWLGARGAEISPSVISRRVSAILHRRFAGHR